MSAYTIPWRQQNVDPGHSWSQNIMIAVYISDLMTTRLRKPRRKCSKCSQGAALHRSGMLRVYSTLYSIYTDIWSHDSWQLNTWTDHSCPKLGFDSCFLCTCTYKTLFVHIMHKRISFIAIATARRRDWNFARIASWRISTVTQR